MMEDEKVAKLFLSAIIGEKVVALDFSTQEHTIRRTKIEKKSKRKQKEKETEETGICFTVCRLDFSAQIELSDGTFKTIVIELQKAKLPSDIMRFRRYLGFHYQNPRNVYGEKGEKAREIYCIYILGYDIGVPNKAIIYVPPAPQEAMTKEEVEEFSEFIQSTHHRSWIVQMPQLKKRHKNDLEKIMSIFDQENRTKNHHILNVHEEEFPEEYRSIIRRLRMASESEDIQTEMEMEDDYIQELQDKERLIEEQAEAIKKKDKSLEEKDKAIEEKDKTIEEQAKIIEELKKTIG
jgi:hypothetical protein